MTPSSDITTAAGTATSITQTAQAEISDHLMAYIETPAVGLSGIGNSGLYAKAGYIQLTVNTGDSLGTGAAYGNVDINGDMWGIGIRHLFDTGIILKLEGTFTDYDAIQLKSTGSDAATTIDADIDSKAAKLSLGYSF